MGRRLAYFTFPLFLLMGSSATRSQQVPPSLPPAPENQYVGSSACMDCHSQKYNGWRSTRHSYSILSGSEAKLAGYPLPKDLPGGGSSTIRKWEDVLYTVGGRKRIAYIDVKGLVQETSFHHRIGKWNHFPSKLMDCGPCHHTGYDRDRSNPVLPTLPGSWTELAIGCEACHGPGGKHTETLRRTDIRLDASSRLCGECHTLEGRALPDDEHHATHDLVQNWNQDRHVTGVQFNSHDAFCARCHSPYEGSFLDRQGAVHTRVFAEEKSNITCIACHDPHTLTHPSYSRAQVSLDAPRPPRSQIFKGNDRDVTTRNFEDLSSADEVCLRCHSGADRVDLDHGEATCVDCHNVFQHASRPETRILQDVNYPELNCRSCHENGDHFMAILYQDPDFLQPKNIHNLARLPQEVIARYGFLYPSLSRVVPPPVPQLLAAPAPPFDDPVDATSSTKEEAGASSESQFEGALDYLQLALDRVDGEPVEEAAEEAVQLVEQALGANPSVWLLKLPLLNPVQESVADFGGRREPENAARGARLGRILRGRGNPELELWMTASLNLLEKRFLAAQVALQEAVEQNPERLELWYYLALSLLAQHHPQASVDAFETILEAHPDHTPSRLALGVSYLRKKEFSKARIELEGVIRSPRERAIASFFLGLGYLAQRDLERARNSLESCLEDAPDLLEAYFALSQVHRLDGRLDQAINAHREVIRRRPDHARAHFELARLYKYWSDRMGFRGEAMREKAFEFDDPQVADSFLTSLAEQVTHYQELALSEFALTLRLEPGYMPAILQVAEIHRKSGRLAEALQIFRWAADRQPGHWLISYRAGTILLELGRSQEAVDLLQTAIGLSPTSADSYMGLGLAYLRLGRMQEAMEAFRQGLVHEPFNPGLHTNLGAAHAHRGEHDQAREYLQRAIQLGSFPLPRLYLPYTNLGRACVNKCVKAQAAFSSGD